jgi:lysophospholipase L1-like esterase
MTYMRDASGRRLDSIVVPSAAEIAGTYVTSGVPAYAGSRPNRYDPVRSVYNWKPSNTRRLRAAIAKSTPEAAGTGLLLAIGDSETAGKTTPVTTAQTSSWPNQLRAALVASGCADGGTGTVFPGTGVNDTQWTLGSGFTANTLFMSWSGGAGKIATFTGSRAGTIATVYYFNNSGAFTVSIDGGTAVTVTPTGAQSVGTYRVTGLSNSTHTITVTSVGTLGYIIGASVTQGTGLVVCGAGASGSKTTEWITTTFSSPRPLVMNSQAATPDAVFIALGVNDAGVNDLVTYKANLVTLVTAIKATSDAVLVSMLQPTQNSQTLTSWQTYVSVMYDVADSQDIPLIDASDVLGSAALAAATSLTSTDAVPHPNAAGYGVIARAIRAVVVS